MRSPGDYVPASSPTPPSVTSGTPGTPAVVPVPVEAPPVSTSSGTTPSGVTTIPSGNGPSSVNGSALQSTGQSTGPSSVQPPPPISSETPDLRAPALYLNRELSWLEFNARVLAEAENEVVPLLERLKFHAIVGSNVDEFFMVRVAGLKQQLTGEVGELAADGLTAHEQLVKISLRAHELVAQQMTGLIGNLLPRLASDGTLVLVKPEQLSPDAIALMDERFHTEVFPILTPIAIDPGHPFPHVRNKSLNLGVMFSREGENEPGFGVVQVPMMLPRLLEVSGYKTDSGMPAKHAFVLLEDLIARHVGTIFPGVRHKGVYTFRVTRNFDLEIDEEEAQDLLQTIQQELRRRERGAAVRLEVAGEPSADSLAKLVRSLKLDPERDVYRSAFLNVSDLMGWVPREERRDLRDDPYSPLVTSPLRDTDDIFATIREGDILLHHPYESFDPIVELITRAADDPDVLAIKQTLYRAGGDSPIVKALARAAETGKQVTAIVELKARFDEESNIVWARTLEQSGVHVVYGLLGLKTHAKCLLIIRRERGGLRRYVHLSTGNYNTTTSRLYTDVALLTAKPSYGADASSLFNLLTGYSAPAKWNSLVVAPLGLHEAILGLIAREAEHARQGRPARIVAKMNSLVDEDVIEALYRASQVGVPISLLVRGICCLRPGVPGVSENIEVRALIDRYLEHGRIFHFANAGKDEVYISSADWMPRNFHRRVEVMIPMEDSAIRTRLIDTLNVSWSDNVKGWVLEPNGAYVRAQARPGQPLIRSQAKFIEQTRDKVKVADQAARPSTRFHMMPTAQRSPLEGKVPRPQQRRRARRDEQ
ncbi:polyphosphate kinase 1 [Labilithrix luteola]|uniref:polyphosphate kinase 1 n=1 Tax=Labilithrix luteola TaxID=1391654 RepID=UPI000ABFE984|nr:polyphosphate kinase 1 [Labilithrix luteola]